MAAKDFPNDSVLANVSAHQGGLDAYGPNKAELMNHHFVHQFQDDEFEPISIVTPPRKRVKGDDNSFNPGNCAFDRQPLNSFQYFGFVNNNNISGFNGFQNHPHNPYFSNSLSSAGISPHLQAYNQNISAFSQVSAMMHNNFDLETSIPNASPLERSKSLEDFEPLFTDNTQNPDDLGDDDDDNSDRCPDLCASSSSLQPEDGFIIGSSDSFKENNYAKAEIITPGTEMLQMNMARFPAVNVHKNVMTKSHGNDNRIPCASEDDNNKISEEGPNNASSHMLHKDSSASSSRFKPFHEEKWSFHYQELLNFKKEKGDCLVPHTYPAKPHLARWVKRQRRQYKLRLEGNSNSTMTEERINILNDIGFVWDSHEVIWNERFNQLVAYKEKFGNCRVPSYCKECPQLASWVKCQRRQYKLFWEQGKGSSMNLDRIKLLNSIGFIWEVHPGRKRKEDEQHFQHLANILMDS
eukprot:CAMPEP_0203672566 /NCGR_PEP_ID=MMETSP0090-20130426/8589_1 /ASSEMBLY_ACC=CAM_ASM_001088 /TAXON_ID=426623 /ORGANISM="Chaetoceros affinis, Strain CCMP159" /LENGTH=465 /DNA_ID=CAMNT_0050537901 /DNA_START=85 /DNA_END=1482 /DNA_ORIENTATION=+